MSLDPMEEAIDKILDKVTIPKLTIDSSKAWKKHNNAKKKGVAVNKLKLDKSPGLDGLPSEF